MSKDEQIIQLTRTGLSASQIAALLNLTYRQIRHARKRLGITQPPIPPLSDEELAHASQLLDDGCSYMEVARTLGRSEYAVRHRFPGRGWSGQERMEWARMHRNPKPVMI